MKLRELFECIKCFMIGDYKQTSSGIDDILCPEKKPCDINSYDDNTSSPPLYVPPEEDCSKGEISENIQNYTDVHSDVEDILSSGTTITDNKNEELPNLIIFKRVSDIVEELDLIKQKLNSSETVQMVNFCQEKIIESLYSSGASLIKDENTYSSSRHRPSPYGIYPEGVHIKQTLRPGLIIQNEIVLKAVVEI